MGITERKDVLSAFFCMLTMLAYIKYAERSRPYQYRLALLALALGLMAKPMLVTLPFVLLLLDYWPLGRLQSRQISVENGAVACAWYAFWHRFCSYTLGV